MTNVSKKTNMDLSKKSLPMQKTIQTFKVLTLRFRLTND